MTASLLIVTHESQTPEPQPKATLTDALSEFYSLMPGLWRGVEQSHAADPLRTTFADITVFNHEGEVIERAVKIIVTVGTNMPDGTPAFEGPTIMVETTRARADLWTTSSRPVQHRCHYCEKPVTWDNGLDEWFHLERTESGEYAVFCEGTTGEMASLRQPL